jgi:hypothetical protein
MRAVALAVAALGAAGSCGCGADVPSPAAQRPPADTRPATPQFTAACAREAGRVNLAVLCPARLPDSGYEPARGFGDPPCAYLVNLEPRNMTRRSGSVFHLLIGGRCRPWDLRTRGGRWPAVPRSATGDGDLRLVGTEPLRPGESALEEAERGGLRVLRAARVGGARALVLRNPPYPAGGIHGGHVSVVWNAGGAGYVVSGHAWSTGARGAGEPGKVALARATETLLAVAASMRRAP